MTFWKRECHIYQSQISIGIHLFWSRKRTFHPGVFPYAHIQLNLKPPTPLGAIMCFCTHYNFFHLLLGILGPQISYLHKISGVMTFWKRECHIYQSQISIGIHLFWSRKRTFHPRVFPYAHIQLNFSLKSNRSVTSSGSPLKLNLSCIFYSFLAETLLPWFSPCSSTFQPLCKRSLRI